MAWSQTFMGMCEASKMVPTLTVKGLRHEPHLWTPTLVDLPLSL